MSLTKTLISTLLALSLLSCNSGNDGQGTSHTTHTAAVSVSDPATEIVPDYDSTLIKGKVTDSVICRAHTTQSYALYLPSYYTATKTFPAVCFFDAHGRGALPVHAYKALAEKYGIILIGSNTSKNGTPWDVTRDMAKAMITDARTRLNIDAKRIYTSGFSGGSRVAVTIAIVDGGVAGVIGTGASFPKIQYELKGKFDYFGIAGYYDFNYTEMLQWDILMSQNGYDHQMLVSAGVHGWPDAASFETALLWMQVNAIKKHLAVRNDSLVAVFKADYDKRIVAATDAYNLIGAYELADGAITVLNGVSDIAAYKKQQEEIRNNGDYAAARGLEQQLQEDELNKQQELMKEFTAQNEQWWAKKIADYNTLSNKPGHPQTSAMYHRLLNYLGFVAYMNTTRALTNGDLPHAETYLHIFKMADPKNPDVSYLTAILYMKKGSTKQAVAALNDAVSAGFNDVSLLKTDPVFASLHEDPAFKNTVIKAGKNLSK